MVKVIVELAVSSCRTSVPYGMKELIQAALEKTGAEAVLPEGECLFQLFHRARGSCHKRGLVMPKGYKDGLQWFVAQPGDNGTCWELTVRVSPEVGEEIVRRFEVYYASLQPGTPEWLERAMDKLSDDLCELAESIDRFRTELSTSFL